MSTDTAIGSIRQPPRTSAWPAPDTIRTDRRRPGGGRRHVCLSRGGWLTPHELTPARFIDGFEEVNGVHPGFRRNHAKGLGVSGFFESNGDGVRLFQKHFCSDPAKCPGDRLLVRRRNALC